MPTDVGGAKLKACLSSETQASLVQHQAALSELLRHFWACFPTVSAQLEEKVGPFISRSLGCNNTVCF